MPDDRGGEVPELHRQCSRECLIAIFSNQRAVNIKENYFLLHNKNPFIGNAKKECLHSRGNYKLFVEKKQEGF